MRKVSVIKPPGIVIATYEFKETMHISGSKSELPEEKCVQRAKKMVLRDNLATVDEIDSLEFHVHS